jgi:DNA repair protein RecO (recombination protein O)
MYFQDRGIILTRKDFKEKDLLISVYTEKYGKITLQSRGAKRVTSKLSGHLEPGSLSTLNWVSGKNIPQLTGAQLEDFFQVAKQDYQKSFFILKILNLVDQVTRDGLAEQKIFILLFKTLKALEEENDLDLIFIVFGFKLLGLLGLNPSAQFLATEKGSIDFIIKKTLFEIQTHPEILKNKKKFLKILNNEFQQIF